MDDPYPIDVINHEEGLVEHMIPEGLPSREDFLKALDNTGHTIDDWETLVKKYQDYIDKETTRIHHEAVRSGAGWGGRRAEALSLARDDANTRYMPQFHRMLKLEVKDPENLPSSAPLFKEWFPLHMKTSLNDAVEAGADVVRFPVNGEAVAKQRGQPLNPGRARAWTDPGELSTDTDWWFPSEKAQGLGKIYKQRTKAGIKRIEAEYGIKLNPREVTDDNFNEFLEIVLTPELKEAFQIVVYNRGGAVYKRPLMNLKY